MKAIIKRPFPMISIPLGLCSLMVITSIAPASFASSAPELHLSAQPESSDDLEPGLPGRRIGGGTRRDTLFANVSDQLVALTTSSSLTITAAAQPVFLFHVPEMTSANIAEFVLRDSNDELIYESTFLVLPEGGIISTKMPQTADMPALHSDENYQWYFSIYAEGADRANDVGVHGSIRRVNQADWLAQQSVEADLSEQLMTAEPLMRAKLLYQEANLWHDAAVTLHELRQAEPKNDAIASEWTQLLESVGITRLIQPSSAFTQASIK